MQIEGRQEGVLEFFDGDEKLFRLYRPEGAYSEEVMALTGDLYGVETSQRVNVPHREVGRLYTADDEADHGGSDNVIDVRLPEDELLRIKTPRLDLEPVTEQHAAELCDLFRDPDLHTFLPFVPLTLEQQFERCSRWAKRRSPDGSEVWLNWVGRDRATEQAVAHFQAGIKEAGIASIGYLVGTGFQRRGVATEGLEAVFAFLRDHFAIREVKAWSDSRNEASHRLARKLGMKQVDFIKDADFFKGSSSDEFVFSRAFAND